MSVMTNNTLDNTTEIFGGTTEVLDALENTMDALNNLSFFWEKMMASALNLLNPAPRI